MLRLRPSELTLTSEDVDETFRRIARRQTSRATTIVSSRPSGHAGRPILRRGPQRSTRDAITALGNIPILRPPPQQAVYTSVYEDIDVHEDQDEETPSMERVDRVTSTSPSTPNEQAEPALAAASSALRSIHLPFRLRRHRQSSDSEPTPDEQGAEACSQPPAESSESAALSPVTIASPNNTNGSHVQLRPGGSPDSPAELRGGGLPSKDRTHGGIGDASRTPSPLHQAQRPSLPRAPEPSRRAVNPQESPRESHPILYLQGYWKDPLTSPAGIYYDFHEMVPQTAQTEPRRRSRRQRILARSLSSGNAPTYAGPTQRPNPSGSFTNDMFSPVPAPEPPTRAPRATSGRDWDWSSYESSSDLVNTYNNPPSAEQGMAAWRQYSRTASTASAAFSYYGSDLPGSRHSSREQSRTDQWYQPQSQFGTEASSFVSPYQPPRPLEIGRSSDSLQQPPSSRGSSQSSPNLASSAQHGFSPLPSMPYNRVQSAQSSVQPSTGSVNNDNTYRNYIDAATAAAQDLRSPLDDYSEQYQRSLRAQNARQTMPAQPSSYPQQLDGASTFRPHQGIDSHHHNRAYDPPHGRSGMDYRPLPPPIDPRSNHRSHEHAPNLTSQSYQRTRANQRSSENVPVNPTSTEARPARRGPVHLPGAASQAPQAPVSRDSPAPPSAPSRSNIPQTTAPRDVSNRPRRHIPPQQPFASRVTSRRRNDGMSSNLPTRRQTSSTSAGASGSPPPFLDPRISPRGPSPSIQPQPRYTSQQHHHHHHHSEIPTRLNQPPRSYRHPSSTLHLHPTARNEPSTSLALAHGTGTTSTSGRQSRSPIVRTATSSSTTTRMLPPRVPARQRDQENSGEGELAQIRREEAAINSRYGEEEEMRDVMDETPPRIGRVERRMFE